MAKNDENDLSPAGISRRQLLAGAASAALVAGSPFVLAGGVRSAPKRIARAPGTSQPSRRYMAATVALPDGRVLVTGGYDRPWDGGKAPRALSSAAIYDPSNNSWSAAAEMHIPRARHAAVVLPDGRVAVLGGMATQATASVEIYDPHEDKWLAAEPLAQPRYDHGATTDGGAIYVIGGSSPATMLSVEVRQIGPVRDRTKENQGDY